MHEHCPPPFSQPNKPANCRLGDWRDLGSRLPRRSRASWSRRVIASIRFEESNRLRAIVFDRRHVRRNEVTKPVMTSRPKLLLVFCPTLNRLHASQQPGLLFRRVTRCKFAHLNLRGLDSIRFDPIPSDSMISLTNTY